MYCARARQAKTLQKILVVRFGAMGDILHAVPAVMSLRLRWPDAEIAWVLEPRWMPLLAGTAIADHVLPLNRRSATSAWIALRWLRRWRPDAAIDFQGLLKSAATAWLSGAETRIGFAAEALREREAGVFYSETVLPATAHIVDRNVELAGGDSAKATQSWSGPLGFPQGTLPAGDFVLCAPFAGWKSKQWPVDRYAQLGELMMRHRGLPLVMNVMPGTELPQSEFFWRHESGMEGLIDATRRARAVVGLDSGPMHLAATLGKPGVALFGPTDPARNGPYGGTIRVLRAAGAATSYKREEFIAESMSRLKVDEVWSALSEVLN